MAKILPHDNITPYAETTDSKKNQIATMFDKIANRYDFLNHFLSAGIDVSWRKKTINYFKNENPKHLLDVACGTADMSIIASKLLDIEKITGIDISEQMLTIGLNKIEKEGLTDRIKLQLGDSEAINFPNQTFDGIMVAFGVRNFENLEKGLFEMLRVLKPGGQLVVLEFSKPANPIFRTLYNFYMGTLAPLMVQLFSKNKKAYKYLNESAKAFPDRQAFIELLNATGYSETTFKPLSLGICCIYSGRKLT